MPMLSSSATTLFERDALGKPQIQGTAESVYTFGTLIRKAEELLLQLFSQGLLSGTTHTCLGQEICAMSVVRALNDPEDVVLSNHRNHGHFLTYSGDFLGLIAEIMGRSAGVCNGVGGSQHIAFRHFHSNGVQGGMTAIGVGHGLAMKRRKHGGIVASIVGDGTLGEGLLYESLNLASVWDVPVLFVVENNRIAQTTPTADTIGGSIEARGAAFGLRTWRFDDSDPAFLGHVGNVVDEVRGSGKPGFLVIDTVRLGPHSKGDDLRESAEMDAARERDPLARIGRQLSEAQRAAIDEACREFMRDVHDRALASSESKFDAPRRHIFGNRRHAQRQVSSGSKEVVRASLNRALGELLTENPDVLLIGEDLHDPYGGAFKVTAGLSSRFKDRVISTPISEAAIAGAAIGLASAGYRPVVEIMFADFSTLVMDQIYNHAVKFPGMFDHSKVPLVVRTPSGGRRGYGPTHSQSMENLMAAVPGLTVVFPSIRHDPGELLRRAVIEWDYPTFFFEHKLMYGRQVDGGGYTEVAASGQDIAADLFPTVVNQTSDPDVCLVAIGDAVTLAEAVAAQLKAEEVEAEILIPSLLSPLPRHTLVAHLMQRPRIVVVEEAPAEFGFSAELAAALLEAGYRGSYRRVAPPPVPIPAARSLELTVMPSEANLFDTVVETILADLI
jgi:2-oxoisovalerate dehydrogenase E1 component